MKTLPSCSARIIPGALCLLLAISACNAKAGILEFNPGGPLPLPGGDYSWDNPVWGGGTPGYWIPGSTAGFSVDPAGHAYSLTAHNNELMAGLYETVSDVSLTLNGTGAGTLDVTSGDQAFSVYGSVLINAPISGSGGVVPEGNGSLYLYGTNTYSGGTTLGYSGYPLVWFNNSNSFGTGAIKLKGATGDYQGLLATGGNTITLPNNFQVETLGTGVDFGSAANTPVISTGWWNLGTNNLMLKNNGDATAPLTISGVISGTAGLSLSANYNGTIILSGANTYTGTTTIGKGASAVTLKLGAANTIAGSSGVVMAGGTLDPGGLSHAMFSTTLGLTAASVIDFGAGPSELDFASSSSLTWAGTLNLTNWDSTKDKLRFGTDATGLTVGQLAEIEFNGSGLGTAKLDSNGYLVVFEPSTGLLSQPAMLSSNVFQFQLSGLAAQNYTVQVSTNLASTNWLTLLITNLSASPVLIQDSQATPFPRLALGKGGSLGANSHEGASEPG